MGEVVMVNTITEEQFLESFRKVCQDFTENYKKQEDPDDPAHLFWSRDFAMDRVKEMPEEYYDIGKRTQYGQELDGYDLFLPMDKIKREYELELRSWFAVAGYDEAGIPAALEIDHAKRKMTKAEREDWQSKIGVNWFRGADAKTAYQIGQLVYTGSSSTSKGWADLYLLTGIRLCHFHPNTSGVSVWNQELTEAAWSVAEKLSRLTDWSKFTEALPKKVRRSITKKMREIIDETELRAYSRLG
jgi:hypothetical protein